mmetsp:Transcript_42442/g.125913  ORF Transcript_42442/g.125913 Transcript_42442/m.125913 type:complete len:227 (-) Transcript_42442:223-903(-)
MVRMLRPCAQAIRPVAMPFEATREPGLNCTSSRWCPHTLKDFRRLLPTASCRTGPHGQFEAPLRRRLIKPRGLPPGRSGAPRARRGRRSLARSPARAAPPPAPGHAARAAAAPRAAAAAPRAAGTSAPPASPRSGTKRHPAARGGPSRTPSRGPGRSPPGSGSVAPSSAPGSVGQRRPPYCSPRRPRSCPPPGPASTAAHRGSHLRSSWGRRLPACVASVSVPAAA